MLYTYCVLVHATTSFNTTVVVSFATSGMRYLKCTDGAMLSAISSTCLCFCCATRRTNLAGNYR